MSLLPSFNPFSNASSQFGQYWSLRLQLPARPDADVLVSYYKENYAWK